MGTENLSTSARLSGRLSGVGGLNGNMSTPSGGDYSRLIHKPSINNVELNGNKTSRDLGIPVIYYGTTEEWNAQRELVSMRNTIYIYTDYATQDETNIPGMKIGDGDSYLIDLPFINMDLQGVEEALQEHVLDFDHHVTPEEKEFWNSKHKALVEDGTLSFTDL